MSQDSKIVAINRLSESQQGQFWPVVFLDGCNLRCQYCLNTSIVENAHEYISMESVLATLDAWGEDGVMISGGEPLMPREGWGITDLIEQLSDKGRKVGISTNGTYPDELFLLLSSSPKLISCVSLDCKLSPSVSGAEADEKIAHLCGYPGMQKGMLRSVQTVYEWHEHDDNAQSEVKITLYPPVVDESDVMEIAKLVHPDSKLVLQQYRQNIMFGGRSNTVEPYSTDEVERLKALAVKSCQAKVEVRWP